MFSYKLTKLTNYYPWLIKKRGLTVKKTLQRHAPKFYFDNSTRLLHMIDNDSAVFLKINIFL